MADGVITGIADVEPVCTVLGSGTRGPFAIEDSEGGSIPFESTDHLYALRQDADGARTALTEGVHYDLTTTLDSTTGLYAVSLTLRSDQAVLAAAAGADPAERLIVYREAPYDQSWALGQSARFPSGSFTQALNRLAMWAQDLRAKVSRALLLPVGEEATAFEASALRKGLVVGFDATTGELGAYPLTTLTDADGVAVIGEYRFTATAGQTAFTIPGQHIHSEQAILVWVGGAFQPSNAYTNAPSGDDTIVTMGSGVSLGVEVVIRVLGALYSTEAEVSPFMAEPLAAADLAELVVDLGGASAIRSAIGLVIGTNVLAYSALAQARLPAAYGSTSALTLIDATERSTSCAYVTAGYSTPGDGGGGVWCWSADDLSAEVAADPLRGCYAAPSGQDGSSGAFVRIRPSSNEFDVCWFGAKFDATSAGVGTDNTNAIQAAINLASFFQGGDVVLPIGLGKITSGLEINAANVRLVGRGRGATHYVAPTDWSHIDNTAFSTGLIYVGVAGATMVLFQPTGPTMLVGVGSIGITYFSSPWPHANAADHCVRAMSCSFSDWDVFSVEPGVSGLSFGCLDRDPATNENSCVGNKISFGGRAYSKTGKIFDADGVVGKGNFYNNSIENAFAHHQNGVAIRLGSTDNNVIQNLRVERAAGGTGIGVLLDGHATDIDGVARYNVFEGSFIPGAGGVVSRGTTTYVGGYSAFDNRIEYYNGYEASSPAAPIIETGSELHWLGIDSPNGPVVLVYTAGATWTKPAGLVAVIVECRGGGGGGGGVSNAAGCLAASGGNQGGYTRKRILASTLSATETVTVGAGGLAGSTAGGNGGQGGTSSFGAHCSATGGGGGLGATAAGGYASGTTLGAGSGGDLNLQGQAGGFGLGYTTGAFGIPGIGGGEGGARQRGASGAGIDGANGGGGSGALSLSASTGYAGGVGGGGYVIVTEFYS